MKIETNSILKSSWGYDQTNIDFYKVVSVKNGWATLARNRSRHRGTSRHSWPNTSYQYEGKHRVSHSSEDQQLHNRRLRRNQFLRKRLSVWSGKPQLQTHTC
jgi:hypothetical protein